MQIEQAFCRKPVACQLLCLFLLAFQRAEKGLGFTPLPEDDSGKKTMQLRYPSKTLFCSCKTLFYSCKTPPSPFFALRIFFFNEGTKILHKNCLPVSSYIVTFVSPNNHLNITYDEF